MKSDQQILRKREESIGRSPLQNRGHPTMVFPKREAGKAEGPEGAKENAYKTA